MSNSHRFYAKKLLKSQILLSKRVRERSNFTNRERNQKKKYFKRKFTQRNPKSIKLMAFVDRRIKKKIQLMFSSVDIFFCIPQFHFSSISIHVARYIVDVPFVWWILPRFKFLLHSEIIFSYSSLENLSDLTTKKLLLWNMFFWSNNKFVWNSLSSRWIWERFAC